MSICPSCSEPGVAGAAFCGSCGSRLVPAPPSDAAADPLVGRTLNGTYVIERKIGSGGMGDVYKAIHNKLDAPVALKLVKRGLLGPTLDHRFQREARAASRLRHPNIVAVTDFGQSEDGTLFMVMEYVTGRSLARVIADDAPLPERRVAHIGEQILSALAEAHANRILHRDLKPDNVMIESRRGVPDAVKVLDFGIAKVLAVGAGASTLTQQGLVCGTPGYMSPEQLRGEDLDPRSDVFSVGVVLYEMLTHRLPFDAHTPMEVLHRQLSEPTPPPGARRGRPVSPELEDLVMRALAPEREDRPESADAMREALLAAALAPLETDVGEPEAREPTEVLPRPDSRSPTPAARATPRTPAAPARPSAPPRPATGPPSRGAPSSRPIPAVPATPPRLATAGVAPRDATTALPATAATRLRATRTTSATTTTGRASAFDPAVLKRLEERIAPILGPVAPHLTRKLARAAPTVAHLCRELAAFLPTREEQRQFLAWSAAELGAVAPRDATPAPPTPAPVAWDPQLLERARQELAVHLGPLARVVVRRVALRARSPRELYEQLAAEIPSERERDEFRRHAPA